VSEERNKSLVDLASWAGQNLEPINLEALQRAGLYMEATRINTARVAVQQLWREARYQKQHTLDMERENRRLKFLLRKLFTAEAEYGTGFYNSDKWREAYDALRAEAGIEVVEE
jgi:hypothetical protein